MSGPMDIASVLVWSTLIIPHNNASSNKAGVGMRRSLTSNAEDISLARKPMFIVKKKVTIIRRGRLIAPLRIMVTFVKLDSTQLDVLHLSEVPTQCMHLLFHIFTANSIVHQLRQLTHRLFIHTKTRHLWRTDT